MSDFSLIKPIQSQVLGKQGSSEMYGRRKLFLLVWFFCLFTCLFPAGRTMPVDKKPWSISKKNKRNSKISKFSKFQEIFGERSKQEFSETDIRMFLNLSFTCLIFFRDRSKITWFFSLSLLDIGAALTSLSLSHQHILMDWHMLNNTGNALEQSAPAACTILKLHFWPEPCKSLYSTISPVGEKQTNASSRFFFFK